MRIFQRFTSIWKPGAYHRRPGQRTYFEGWYIKLVNPDLSQRWAVIPGVFHHPDPERAHAFIQVLNGSTSGVDYHRFPREDFHASREEFDVRVGENHFSLQGCRLSLVGSGHSLEGELRFLEPRPWPVTLMSPGVMGPYAFVPFMQTYHGVLSLDHEIQGTLNIDDSPVEFNGGRGYMEKDWGTTFPRAYIWLQSNHFSHPGMSMTASVATIPWLGSWFRGFLVGLWVGGTLYRFTTYLGSQIERLALTDEEVAWELRGTTRTAPGTDFPGYHLEIAAQRSDGGLLSAPELDGMRPRVLESMTASVTLTLTGLDRDGGKTDTLVRGEGRCAGLEVAGSVEELLDE